MIIGETHSTLRKIVENTFMIGEKHMKKLLKKTWFIALLVICVVLLILFLFAYALLGNDLLGGTAEVLSKLSDTQIHWWILGIIVGLVVFALLIMFVLPFLLYILSKISTYCSILLVCIKERYSCKLTRAPFASIVGVSRKADVEIKMNDKKIFIHFIDVPLGFRKMLTILNENNYQISSSAPGSVKRIGGGPPGGNFGGGDTTSFYGKERTATDDNKKCKSIPDFESNDNEFHYLIVTPGYVDAKVIVGNGMTDVSAETTVEKITVCKYKTLKKRLRNQLYTPMNNN